MSEATRAGWEFWIDRGGTFTDLIGAGPDGRLRIRKLLTPAAPAGGADVAIEAALAMLAEAGAPATAATALRIGTTVATNALLTRSGARVLLVTTRGFADALAIGYQDRPDLFALRVRRAPPLFAGVLEIDERVDAAGRVLLAPDPARCRAQLEAARRAGFDAVAIVLMHGWQHAAHERELAQLARTLGFAEISVSHELMPLQRLIARGDSTVFNAYLAPALRTYVQDLQRTVAARLPTARLQFMQSAGGLAGADGFRALGSVLSGPAGGLIGMARIGKALGVQRLIGFDMGGTSTDVSLFDGEFRRRFEHVLDGARLATPMLDVHTIAAGGGSILGLRDGRRTVGPASAGARPGPASYGHGGPATLTDVQAVLGRLLPASLPRVFGAGGDGPLDLAAAHAALRALALPSDLARGVAALAQDYLDVGIAQMANAIRHVCLGQGADPARYTLFAFGGAAGQHACSVARQCGIGRVLLHPLASVLSAYGIGVADTLEIRRRGLVLPLDARSWRTAVALLGELEQQARAALDGSDAGARAGTGVEVAWIFELRDGANEATLDVQGRGVASLRRRFAAAHRRRFGYEPDPARVVIAAVRAEAVARHPHAAGMDRIDAGRALELPATTRAWIDGRWRDVPVVDARAVPAALAGPALVVDPHSTFVLEEGWQVGPLAGGALLAERSRTLPARRPRATAHAVEGAAAAAAGTTSCRDTFDGARMEIFNGLFMHVASQMGDVLRRTAQSVNIRERLDFSCAVFDAAGGLVANAPHMPVHLGSMGSTVKALLASRAGRIERGAAWMVNSPWHGGTHLPDITVVSPVFLGSRDTAPLFVASRAHHADLGGMTPGSMPPFSRSIDEEGVLFADFDLVRGGRLCEDELRAALARGPWPARNPDQNVADLRAQLAANARGAAELDRAQREHGAATLRAAMTALQDHAADCVSQAIRRLGTRRGRFALDMDAGQRIVVDVGLDAATGRARIDFTGSSPAGAHNFNAPLAVTHAAVLYVFRTLVDQPIPLNEGCLRPLELHVPAGSILDPPRGAAVVAGNVETSQVIVDALYGALGIMAAAQGTMNNLTFGNESLQYYETIAGGSGAGRDFDGCDAIQTHMTNSRLTDPEVLEARYPLLLREFSVRRGSGGVGRQRGGDGALRRIEFRAPLQGAMLANRRRTRPFGLEGGAAALAGRTRILRANGSSEELPACAAFALEAGDVLEIATPGGGGFGLASGAADEAAQQRGLDALLEATAGGRETIDGDAADAAATGLLRDEE
jgi:5-oxoprolinase (ATP-hydrolysing)